MDDTDPATRAVALVPFLAARAEATEARRSADPAVIQAMKDARLYRLTQPRRIGGDEASLGVMHQVVATLAEGCASSAWVLMVQLAHSWMLGMFPQACQDEVAADDPDTLISGALAPGGAAVMVDGGYRVSGRWTFASGCDHALWNILGVLVPDAAKGQPRQVHVLAPARDYAIDDNWFTLGLRGTGSKTLVLEDVFVPDHRTMATAALFRGDSPHAADHVTGLYGLPLAVGLAFHISAPLLGLARAAQAAFVERTRVRDDKYTGASKAQAAGMQFRVAQSELELQAAGLMLEDAGRRFDAMMADRRAASDGEKLELRAMIAYAVECCRSANSRIFAASGANSIYDASPLQRHFRDMNVASHHAMIDLDTALEQLGRRRLGLDPTIPVL